MTPLNDKIKFPRAAYCSFIWSFFLFLWCHVSLLEAQEIHSIVRDINDEPIQGQILDKELAIFEDSTAMLNLADIRSGAFDSEFNIPKHEFPALFNPKANFWVKLTLQNGARQARDLIIENRYPMLDFLTLYQIQTDGSYSALTLGDEVDYEQRPIAFRFPAYPIRLEVGTNIFYLKMQNKGRFVASLLLWDNKNFAAYAKKDGLVLGLIYGSMIVLTLYNMFLMISFRSETYLLYVLYLLSYIGMQFGLQATGIEWIGGSLGHWIMNRGWLVFGAVAHVFACLFAASFLNMHRQMPNWIKWINGLALVNAFVAIHCIFGDYVLIGKELSFATIAVSFVLIAAGITAAKRGFQPAIFYSFAWTTLLIGNFILTLMFNGLFPMNFLAQWGSFLGGAMEVTLMSLALGSRMNYRQARAENTIRSLNSALKLKIQEVEKIVLERSQTIRSIIDHVKSGFFTINEYLEIQPGFTKSCYGLLGDRLVQHSSILNVLNLDGHLRSTFKLSV